MKPSLYTARGYARLMELLAVHLRSAVVLTAYSVALGLASVVTWAYRRVVLFTRCYPKALLFIVAVLFALQYITLTVQYGRMMRAKDESYDSLAVVKDSIALYSSFDSGYARGLSEGQRFLLNDNGDTEKEDTVCPTRRDY